MELKVRLSAACDCRDNFRNGHKCEISIQVTEELTQDEKAFGMFVKDHMDKLKSDTITGCKTCSHNRLAIFREISGTEKPRDTSGHRPQITIDDFLGMEGLDGEDTSDEPF